MKKIKNWIELSKIKQNNEYRINVDLNSETAWINPLKENDETKRFYFVYHIYLPKNSFCKEYYKSTNKILQKCGFNIELEYCNKKL